MAADVEGRELAKGKAGEPYRVRTQWRTALHPAHDHIRQTARRDYGRPLTALLPHVYGINRRRDVSNGRNCAVAPGVDGHP
jgi:hypothetical protein